MKRTCALRHFATVTSSRASQQRAENCCGFAAISRAMRAKHGASEGFFSGGRQQWIFPGGEIVAEFHFADSECTRKFFSLKM